jgi:integrase
MKNPIKNAAGEIVRFITHRMGVTIARPEYAKGQFASRFYYAKMINGQLARFPLSHVPADAQRLADEIAAFLSSPTNTLDDAKRKFNPRALERKSEFSTIGDVLEYHLQHWKILEIGQNTGVGYHQSMLVLLRQVDAFRKGTEFENWSGRRKGMDELKAPWLARSTTVLTEQLASDYQRAMVPPDLEDEEEELSQKITCDSTLRCARAIFSKEALRIYRASHAIKLPDLTEFLSVSLFNAKKYFELPDPAVIRKVFAAAPLFKASDLNAYRAFLVCVQAGLRKSEAAHLRMDWLHQEETPALHIHADGAFKPKHGHGRKVFLDPWVSAEMAEIAAPGQFFIEGTDTERTEEVFSRLNVWLRGLGIEANKPTHELRKLWFSQKTKREGVLAAAKQGGHKDVKITQSFYADCAMPADIIPFWQEPTLAALAHTKTA